MITNYFNRNKYLFYGDSLVFDRWRWISKRLPITNDNWKLLDIGCGSGAITLKAASKGYVTRGLSWSKEDMEKCSRRAKYCSLKNCTFDVFDARNLSDYCYSEFDVIINTENIEHIINDINLFKDIYSKLRNGGYLLLTTPNFFYNAITINDNGPFNLIEDGRHVRRGYTKTMLEELCEKSGFKVQEITTCSGFLSQKLTYVLRSLERLIGLKMSWLISLPLRIFPIIFDPLIKKITNYEDFSICLVAYKPRFK